MEDRLHTDQMTVTGKTVAKLLAPVKGVTDDVIKPVDHPQRPEGGIAVLRGNLAPNGAVIKQSGVKESMYYFKGRARVFNSMEETDAAISAGEIEKGTVIVICYEGPKGVARHARDVVHHRVNYGARDGRGLRPGHGWPVLRATHGPAWDISAPRRPAAVPSRSWRTGM